MAVAVFAQGTLYSGRLQAISLTTAQRLALAPVNAGATLDGYLVYDTTQGLLYCHTNGVWAAVTASSSSNNGIFLTSSNAEWVAASAIGCKFGSSVTNNDDAIINAFLQHGTNTMTLRLLLDGDVYGTNFQFNNCMIDGQGRFGLHMLTNTYEYSFHTPFSVGLGYQSSNVWLIGLMFDQQAASIGYQYIWTYSPYYVPLTNGPNANPPNTVINGNFRFSLMLDSVRGVHILDCIFTNTVAVNILGIHATDVEIKNTDFYSEGSSATQPDGIRMYGCKNWNISNVRQFDNMGDSMSFATDEYTPECLQQLGVINSNAFAGIWRGTNFGSITNINVDGWYSFTTNGDNGGFRFVSYSDVGNNWVSDVSIKNVYFNGLFYPVIHCLNDYGITLLNGQLPPTRVQHIVFDNINIENSESNAQVNLQQMCGLDVTINNLKTTNSAGTWTGVPCYVFLEQPITNVTLTGWNVDTIDTTISNVSLIYARFSTNTDTVILGNSKISGTNITDLLRPDESYGTFVVSGIGCGTNTGIYNNGDFLHSSWTLIGGTGNNLNVNNLTIGSQFLLGDTNILTFWFSFATNLAPVTGVALPWSAAYFSVNTNTFASYLAPGTYYTHSIFSGQCSTNASACSFGGSIDQTFNNNAGLWTNVGSPVIILNGNPNSIIASAYANNLVAETVIKNNNATNTLDLKIATQVVAMLGATNLLPENLPTSGGFIAFGGGLVVSNGQVFLGNTTFANVASSGAWNADPNYAYWGTPSGNTSSGFAITQTPLGETSVNSSNGRPFHIQIGNVDELVVSATGIISGNGSGLTNGLPSVLTGCTGPSAPTIGSATTYLAGNGTISGTTETFCETPVPRGGYITNWCMTFSVSNIGAGSNVVCTLDTNGVSTGITMTLSGGGANPYYVTNTTGGVYIAPFTKVSVKMVPAGVIPAGIITSTLEVQ